MLLRTLIAAFLFSAAVSSSGEATMKWKGEWIWNDAGEKPRNFYLLVRKTFELDKVPKEALGRVSADSRYKLYVNGWLVGRGPVRSDPRWQHYEEYDLGPYLRRGKNVIAALVHHYGESTFQYHLGRGGFLFDSDLVSSDGTWKVLAADAWRRDIPRMDVQLGYPEILDLSRLPDGWTLPGFDDSSWQTARVIGPVGTEPWREMAAPEIPHLIEEFIYPREILEIGTWDSSEVKLEDPTNIALLMSSERREAAPEQPSAEARRFPSPGIDELLQSNIFRPGGRALARSDQESPMRIILLAEGGRPAARTVPEVPVYRNF